MSSAYGPPADKKAMIGLLRGAVERGVTMFDTAEVYGLFTNEELLHHALEPTIAHALSSGQLRVVLEGCAPEVPGLFLYVPSRAQVSPALKAFVDVTRESTAAPT